MSGKEINYSQILQENDWLPDAAIKDLKRYLMLDEPPLPGAVARAIIALQNAPHWISVKDQLPPNAERPGQICPRYLVFTKYGVTVGWYNPDRKAWYIVLWFTDIIWEPIYLNMEWGDVPKIAKCPDKFDVVTHWMPMPEPPEA